ncbi:SGNH/GDSL hydrolase family protein [Bacillus sp. SD088]|uniref:SGNH/GDSL hydrolase family protein n=1 Tax=Bacillus sp. SD088 TaxID=2782012 RepID=UPI001A957AAD|nr:SGNH/GDSL hydrolase family protein [Bacillus sp. SD088]MBO0992671.1 SGNH/GDSL hydrolase family protein [Bacillus sp. SD088]
MGKDQMKMQWKKMIQMQHPEKLLKFARQIDEETLATLYGMDLKTYIDIKSQLEQETKEATDQLLANPEFADRVNRLPFEAGQTVIGVGESTTDDLLSWFEILRRLLERQRPQDNIRMINEGISGDTSTQLLGRFNGILAQEPDWIICMIGGNDVLRFGPEPTKTQVSAEETARNISEIRRISTVNSAAQWVWITPTPINDERMAAFPYFRQLCCRNEDIHVVSNMIHRLSDPVIDTQTRFGMPASPEWMEVDGLHPSISGHKAIVTWLVEELTRETGM